MGGTAFVWKKVLVVDQKAHSRKECPVSLTLLCSLPRSRVYKAVGRGCWVPSTAPPSSISQWTDTLALHHVAFMIQTGKSPGSSHVHRIGNIACKGHRALIMKKMEALQMSIHAHGLDHTPQLCEDAELQLRR